MDNMAKVIFENLTPKQAKILAIWYEGQGEQDAEVWFDVNGSVVPLVESTKQEGDDVIVCCK